jgi:bacterioferritin
VADGAHRLLGLDERAHEGNGVRVGAQEVGVGHAAGQHESVVVVGAGVGSRLVSDERLALVEVLETLERALLQRDQVDLGALVLDRLQRVGQLDLLDPVGGQEGNALAVQLAHSRCSFGCLSHLRGYRPSTEGKRVVMAQTRNAAQGILADDNAEVREHIIELLKKAYWMEIETVMSYITNSVNPDGVRAQEIVESLNADIQEELGHAQQFAARIKELYGVVPGSLEFTPEQSYLQPPDHQTDITHVIKGVIEAETGAIEHYNRIIQETDQVDPVTQDMVIAILRDEEGHRRLFEGYLREYEAEGLA